VFSFDFRQFNCDNGCHPRLSRAVAERFPRNADDWTWEQYPVNEQQRAFTAIMSVGAAAVDVRPVFDLCDNLENLAPLPLLPPPSTVTCCPSFLPRSLAGPIVEPREGNYHNTSVVPMAILVLCFLAFPLAVGRDEGKGGGLPTTRRRSDMLDLRLLRWRERLRSFD